MAFILDAERRPTLRGFDDDVEGSIEKTRDVLLPWMIQEGLKPVNVEHFPKGRFEQLVKVEGVAEILNTEVPPEKRWTSPEMLPENVKILEQEDPELHEATHELSDLAEVIADGEDDAEKTPEWFDALKQYGVDVDKAADATSEQFKADLESNPNTVCLTLKNGGLRSEARFIPPEITIEGGEDVGDEVVPQRVRVEAKRLDVVDEDGKQNLLFGFRDWEGLEVMDAVQEKYGSIRLAIPDDCLATAGSAISAVEVLKEKGYLLQEVVFYGTVGSQQGIQLFIDRIGEMKNIKGMGIEPKVVIAGAVFGLDQNGYLVRLSDEKKPNGKPYGKRQRAVGDMGVNQRLLRQLEQQAA